jgi:hypothetical protein
MKEDLLQPPASAAMAQTPGPFRDGSDDGNICTSHIHAAWFMYDLYFPITTGGIGGGCVGTTTTSPCCGLEARHEVAAAVCGKILISQTKKERSP